MLSSLVFTELIECPDTPPPPVHAAHGALPPAELVRVAQQIEGASDLAKLRSIRAVRRAQPPPVVADDAGVRDPRVECVAHGALQPALRRATQRAHREQRVAPRVPATAEAAAAPLVHSLVQPAYVGPVRGDAVVPRREGAPARKWTCFSLGHQRRCGSSRRKS